MIINKKNFNIAHLVGGTENSGAFKGANLLHNDLLKYNINSNIIYDKQDTKIKLLKSKLRQSIEKLPKIFYPNRQNTSFSSSIIGRNFFNSNDYINANIIHLHWINNGFFNISHLKKINKPIVWTIRDMWPFTGGCHYSLGCEKFISNCNNCPQLSSNKNYDLSTFIQKRKNKYYNDKIKFVVNSNWMNKMASKSSLLKNFEILTFFPSFDLNNFYEENDQKFYNSLNINPKKKIILYGAQNIEAKYKGFKYFIECLDHLDKEKYMIIFFGNFWNEKVLKEKNIEFLNLGFIKDQNIQRKIYNLANVFVATSLQEGFPKTVVESLLCKTPIVYFKETAIEDVCENKKIGGYGANYCDSKDLANGIKWITENNDKVNEIIDKAIFKIKNEFNSEKLIKKYIELYNSLI